MKKGKLYYHEFANPKAFIVVLCTGEGAVESTKVFAGTIVKVSGKLIDEVGDFSTYWDKDMFEPYNKKIVL